jgi:hypothetical protein
VANPGIIVSGSAIYDTHKVSTTYGLRIGTVGFLNGRTYVWCSSSGATALTLGEPLVAAAISEQQNLACTTACLNIGQTKITGITAGLTAITANQFQDGLMVVVDGGGQGSTYQIKSNTAFTAETADGAIELYEPVAIPSDASTEITLIQNKYAGVQRSIGYAPNPFVGIPNVEVPIGSTMTQYFWAQRVGLCAAFVKGSPRRGASVIVARDERGRLAASVNQIEVRERGEAGRSVHQLDPTPVVGQMATDAIDGEIQIVDLQNPIF